MPKFQWEGVTKNGDIKRGIVEASNAQEAANRLRMESITPKKIRKKALHSNTIIERSTLHCLCSNSQFRQLDFGL